MAAENQNFTIPNPEAVNQIPPSVAEFQASAAQLEADFSVEHGWTGGVKADGGIVTDASLATASAALSEAASTQTGIRSGPA